MRQQFFTQLLMYVHHEAKLNGNTSDNGDNISDTTTNIKVTLLKLVIYFADL